MRILVTGATSGLGRNAVEYLLSTGYQVTATGRNPQAGAEVQALGATFIALDLANASLEQCRQLMVACDCVWHCAAKSSPWGDADEFYRSNVLATERLAQAAGEAGITRFIHISTPAVYFGFQHLPDISEDYLTRRFANGYAKTKYQAEQRLQAMLPQYPATTYIILRPRGLFGPHDRVILPRIFAQIKQKKGVLHLPAGGRNALDLTFVLNVVVAMELASSKDSLTSGAVYNITNQQPQPLVDTLQQLFRQLGVSYRIKSLPYPLLYVVAAMMEGVARFTAKEPKLTRYSIAASYYQMSLNTQKARQELGYVPRYSLQQGIELTANWLKQKGHHG